MNKIEKYTLLREVRKIVTYHVWYLEELRVDEILFDMFSNKYKSNIRHLVFYIEIGEYN